MAPIAETNGRSSGAPMTDLVIGDRVRFRGAYLFGGKPDDPDRPHVILTTAVRSQTLSMINGQLTREKPGVYSFVMVVEAMARYVSVRFCSAQGLGEPFAQQDYRVVARSSERGSPAYMAPEQPQPQPPAGPPPVDADRADMVEALLAEGIEITDKHSDGFIRGAHEQLRRKREAEKQDRLRDAWASRR